MSKHLPVHEVVVMGTGGVGKSALTLRYMYNEFVEEYNPTRADNYRKDARIEDTECKLDILDTAGQEDYPVVREAYYKKGEGFMLMFAVNDLDSFSALDEFREQILVVKGETTTAPFLLVGNKVDLEDFRMVTTTEAQNCATKWKCPYIETSAKTCVKVEESFNNLFNRIHELKKIPVETETRGKEERKKTCCCVIL